MKVANWHNGAIYIMAQGSPALALPHPAALPCSWLASGCYTCIIYITAQLLACLRLLHLHHLHYSPALGLPQVATLASFTLQPSSWLASGCYTCIIYITALLLACLRLLHLHHLHYSPALGLPQVATLASFTLQPPPPPPPPSTSVMNPHSAHSIQWRHNKLTLVAFTNQPSQKKQKHTQAQPCSHQHSDSRRTREEMELSMGVCVCVGGGGGGV